MTTTQAPSPAGAITAAAFHRLMADDMPWAHELGLTLETISAGRAQLMLPFDRRSLRPGNTISGPHMMLLADACMYAVVLSLLGDVRLAVTTNLNINFLRKPAPGALTAQGRCIKLGKRFAVLDVSVFGADAMVAHATGTYAIPPDAHAPRPDAVSANR